MTPEPRDAFAVCCAVCGVTLTIADADDLVKTDAGPVHRECFDGPVPPPAKADDFLDEFEPLAEEALTPEEEEAENERRREMGDPPLGPLSADELHQMFEAADSARLARELAECEPEEGTPPLMERLAPEGNVVEADRTDCPECHAEPSINGGRGTLCRGRSML